MTYIAPQHKILHHADRIASWQQGKPAAPVTIEWDLTNRCDLGCAGCHFGYTHTRGPLAKKRPKPAGAEDGGDVADSTLVCWGLAQAAGLGVKSIVWAGGGEPTLHPSFDVVIRTAGALGLEQGLYTHGGHITPERAELLASHMAWVVVSLDCLDAESYAAYKGVPAKRFHEATAGVRNMATAGVPVVGVSFLVGRDNWPQMPAMLELGRSLGATYVTFRPLILFDVANPAVASESTAWIYAAMPTIQRMAAEPDVECSPERFAEYRDWNDHLSNGRGRGYDVCYGVAYSTVVTPNGKLWVCCNRREFSGSCLGDLNQESLADIWARHPGRWTDFQHCRVMCRLHPVNQALAAVMESRPHENFI